MSTLHAKLLIKSDTLAARQAASSDEDERLSMASDAGLLLGGDRLLTVPRQTTPTAISATGTTTITPNAWQPHTQVLQTVSAGSGTYTHKVVLAAVATKITTSTMTPPAGFSAEVALSMPASTNPTIEIRNADASGTVLATIAGRSTARTVLVRCAFNGTAWVLQGVADTDASASIAAYLAALPTSDPLSNGAPWNNGGVVCISTGS